MRFASVYYKDIYCGELRELEDSFQFQYDQNYLNSDNPKPISLSLPLRKDAYNSNVLFPFFDGLIPEGYILDLIANKYDIRKTNRFALLLVSGCDTIGAVTVKEK